MVTYVFLIKKIRSIYFLGNYLFAYANEHTYEPDFFQVFKCVSSTEPNTQPTPEKLDSFRVSYLILTRKTRFFSSFLLGTHLKNSIFSGFFKLLNVNILSF
jgi:hypothetical protein